MFFEEGLEDATVFEEIIVGFFKEWIAIITGLDGIIITGSWREFNISQGTLDIEAETDSVESLGFYR